MKFPGEPRRARTIFAAIASFFFRLVFIIKLTGNCFNRFGVVQNGLMPLGSQSQSESHSSCSGDLPGFASHAFVLILGFSP